MFTECSMMTSDEYDMFGFIRKNGLIDKKINVFSLFQDIVRRTKKCDSQ